MLCVSIKQESFVAYSSW